MSPFESTMLGESHNAPRAIFLDRDGVINADRPDYVLSWDRFHFLDGALSALARLASSGFKVIVITNQSIIGRQLVARERVEDIHRRMVGEIVRSGGRVDGVYFCPHRPNENCYCRKPLPGLLWQARKDLGVDLPRSYLIGDWISDIEAARAVGCSSVLVRTGRGEEAARKYLTSESGPEVIVPDLCAAVDWILKKEEGREQP